MNVFQFRSPTTILFGEGALSQVVTQMKRLGAARPLIVTDKGVIGAGLMNGLAEHLEGAQCPFAVYDGVQPDPGTSNVEAAVEAGKQHQADLVIGLGGGSAIDVAKSAAVVLGLGGRMQDYFGPEKIPARGLPFILIPTTAGSGSEASTAVVLYDEEVGFKKAANSTRLLADVAIIDPLLTLSMPPRVTADTGIDVLAHAIDAYTSAAGSSPLTDALALEAMRLVAAHLRPAYTNGRNLAARTGMAHAATIAGMAFTGAGLGGIHAMAYPLAGEFKVSHGRSNAAFMPHLMRFNLPACPARFAAIAEALGEQVHGLSVSEAADRSVAAVTRLLDDLDISYRLRDYGVSEEKLNALADKAVVEGARLIPNNARRLQQEDARRIYRAAY